MRPTDPASAGRDDVREGTVDLSTPRIVRKRTETSVGTDRVLLALLALLNLGSLYTTLAGARQVLPWPMSDVLGVSVQLMLFLALAGFVGRYAPVRRWIVIVVFASVSVYTSFFCYYDQLAGESLGAANVDRARTAHAAFVDGTWQPVVAEVDRLEREATQGFSIAEREGSSGVTTGVVGFGPVARALAEEARRTEMLAAEKRADMERIRPRFDVAIDEWTAEQIYLHDLETWQQTPDAWKADVPMPARAAWLDLSQEVALLTPYWKVRDGDLAAIAALLLALLVDGTSLMLGSAIHHQRRPALDRWTEGAVRWIRDSKSAGAEMQRAWRSPGGEVPPAPAGLEPLRLVLRVTGRGTEFLGAVYEAIHPETGGIDAARLLDHEDPSWRVAARVLLDRMRDPRVAWVRTDGGRWRVVEYDALTAWLAEQYRHACEVEADAANVPDETLLQLPVPA